MRVAGVDEAGCGALMGDLVAAAAVLPEGCDVPVADSKTLSAARRTRLYDQLVSTVPHGIGRVSAQEIDALGMARCRRLVLTRALDDLAARHEAPEHIIVDGTLFDAWHGVPHECIPKADATHPCVSAASILAKVTRDTELTALVARHPELQNYGLPRNAGYPTAAHRAALREHGTTQWHRTSFRSGN